MINICHWRIYLEMNVSKFGVSEPQDENIIKYLGGNDLCTNAQTKHLRTPTIKLQCSLLFSVFFLLFVFFF